MPLICSEHQKSWDFNNCNSVDLFFTNFSFQLLGSEPEFIDKLNNKEKILDKQKENVFKINEGILSGPGWKDDFNLESCLRVFSGEINIISKDAEVNFGKIGSIPFSVI